MKKIPVIALALLGWLGSPLAAEAFLWCSQPFWCGPPPCVTFQTCVVMSYRPAWREEPVECVVPKVNWREEVVKVNHRYLEPVWDKEKRTIVEYTPVFRDVIQEVVCCRYVPCVWVDPCTGCAYPTFQPTFVTEKVPVRVCYYRADNRDIVVPVIRWEPRERVVEERRWTPSVTYEKVTMVRRVCVMEPCPVTVCVPIFCPAPWPCP